MMVKCQLVSFLMVAHFELSKPLETPEECRCIDAAIENALFIRWE